MRCFSWLRNATSDLVDAHTIASRHYTRHRKPAAARLHLEPLEDRCCPSTTYSITDLGTLGGANSQANAINSGKASAT
jgi:hypothetical protein